MNMDLQTAYERIQNSKSPIEEVGTIILGTGGQWNPAEAADPTKLFTIHLHQIQGVGIGAAGALMYDGHRGMINYLLKRFGEYLSHQASPKARERRGRGRVLVIQGFPETL